MSSTTAIRLARSDDAAQVQAIYEPFVRDTPISFEVDVPSVAEMRQRIEDTLRQYPWLICERSSDVLGYAYAAAHSARAAYQWSVSVSVYVDPRWHRCGVGRALYSSLFAILRLQGFVKAYAGATLPNPSSVGLHEAVGFRPVGVYESVGYKLGAWHDVIWWQMPLQQRPAQPMPPVSMAAAQARPEWQDCLDAGLPLLRR